MVQLVEMPKPIVRKKDWQLSSFPIEKSQDSNDESCEYIVSSETGKSSITVDAYQHHVIKLLLDGYSIEEICALCKSDQYEEYKKHGSDVAIRNFLNRCINVGLIQKTPAPSGWEFSPYVERATQSSYVIPEWVYRISCGEGEEPVILELREFDNWVLTRFVSGDSIEVICEKAKTEYPSQAMEPNLPAMVNRLLIGYAKENLIKKVGTPPVYGVKTKQVGLFKKIRTNPFYVDLPLINPTKMLNTLEPLFGWMLSTPAVLLGLVFTAFSLMSFFGSEFQLETGGGLYEQFMRNYNWFYILVGLVILKIPHEFAHGLALRRAGRNSYEMGFILLIFTPCLYCRVDEVRLCKSKWKKLSVALAGIYVDLIITSFAALLYLANPADDVAQFARLVVYANLGFTMFVNLIPLMRFDGHYALAYLWGRPNLGSDARSYLSHKYSWLLHNTRRKSENDADDWFVLILFGVASLIYSYWIKYMIITFCYGLGQPAGLGWLTALFAAYILFKGNTNIFSAWDRVRK